LVRKPPYSFAGEGIVVDTSLEENKGGTKELTDKIWSFKRTARSGEEEQSGEIWSSHKVSRSDQTPLPRLTAGTRGSDDEVEESQEYLIT
jgi:hypothetical protein